jgi:membrane associated rhomboid family serine protease
MHGLGSAATLFGVTIVVSLLGLFVAPRVIERSLFRPYWLQRRGEYWTLLTSGFVHADLTHLLFNMVTFYYFAFPLERTIGPLRLLLLYLLALVLSNLGTFLKQRNNPDYASLGASGAISAVLFAFAVYYPTSSFFFFPIPVPIPATIFAVVYLGITWYLARHSRGHINHDAHLDGALTGLAFVAFTEPSAYADALRQLSG